MKRWLVTLWAAVRELSGDAAYERYLRDHAATCGHPRLSRRQFYALREQQKWSRVHRCC